MKGVKSVPSLVCVLPYVCMELHVHVMYCHPLVLVLKGGSHSWKKLPRRRPQTVGGVKSCLQAEGQTHSVETHECRSCGRGAFVCVCVFVFVCVRARKWEFVLNASGAVPKGSV